MEKYNFLGIKNAKLVAIDAGNDQFNCENTGRPFKCGILTKMVSGNKNCFQETLVYSRTKVMGK